MDGGLGNVPGGDGGRARRSWAAAPVREDWQGVDDLTIRATVLAVVAAAAAVLSREQLPSSSRTMATRRPDRNDFLSPRRVRREHAVEPDQGVARWRNQRCKAGEELQWRHYAVRLVTPGFANGVRDATN